MPMGRWDNECASLACRFSNWRRDRETQEPDGCLCGFDTGNGRRSRVRAGTIGDATEAGGELRRIAEGNGKGGSAEPNIAGLAESGPLPRGQRELDCPGERRAA